MSKYKIRTLIVIIITLIVLTSCQPSPNTKVVISKGEDAIFEMLKKAGVDATITDGNIEVSIKKQNDIEPHEPEKPYEAPERLDYTLEFANTTVVFDAPVIVPEYALPIWTVKPDLIRYDKVKGFLDIVSKEQSLYDNDFISCIRTKKMIEAEIDKEMSALDSLKDAKTISKDELDEFENLVKQTIKKLYKEFDDAPSTLAEAAKDIEFGKTKSMFGNVITEEMTKPIIINKDNYSDKNYRVVVGETATPLFLNIATTDNKQTQQLLLMNFDTSYLKLKDTISIDEAIKIVKPYVDLLGNELELIDYNLINEDNLGEGYQLIYKRKYNGIESNYARGQCGGWTAHNDPSAYNEPENPRDIYKVPYQQEKLLIQIDGKGNIYNLTYNSPIILDKLLTSNAKLLPFENIKEILDRYIGLHGFNPDDKVKITINKAKLGMMRIDMPDTDDQYLTVPVWDFYGYFESKSIYEGEEIELPGDKKTTYQCFLTINALDGSIIDRALGY